MRATVELSGDRLSLHGPGVRVDLALEDGSLSLGDSSGRRTPVRGWHVVAMLDDRRKIDGAGVDWRLRERPGRFQDVHGAGVRALVSSEPVAGLRLHLEICLFDTHPFALFRAGLENVGSKTRRVAALMLSGELDLVSPPSRCRIFRHGWQSWSPALSLSGAQFDIGVRSPVLAPEVVPNARGSFASDEVTALLDPATGHTLTVGFVSAHRCITQVCVDAPRRALEAVASLDGAHLAPGETVWSERLLVAAAEEGPAALERYAGTLAREMGARVPATSPSGWCSWYYYFTSVSEGDVLRNLSFLERQREALPFEYVQIDDGYQAEIGDWLTTNEKFPRGMAWLADQIRDSGFTPGIWLAPFIAGGTSQLYREHPGWFVQGEDGAPAVALSNWSQDCHGLDCTNPEAEAWLRALFREVTEGWGYDYLKIDFLFGAAIAGRRHNRNASRIEAYRRGLRAVRESVGDRFVLGCGALMGASVGLIDGQRIGPDVAPWWRYNRPVVPPREKGRPHAGGEPSTENSLRNILTRSWMHGQLWANDPDCLVVRSTRTKLTLPEVQTLATAIAMSGGMVLASDDLAELSADRLDMVSLLLPPLGQAARAPDLLTESMPEHLLLEVKGDFEPWWLVARFNWKRRRRALTTELPAGPWHVFELWERRYHGLCEGELVLPDVPAHGARLLALRRPLDRPQVVGTTFHASMGALEIVEERFDPATGLLEIDLRPVAKKQGTVLVNVPEGYGFVDAWFARWPLRTRKTQDGPLSLHFELNTAAALRLGFRRE